MALRGRQQNTYDDDGFGEPPDSLKPPDLQGKGGSESMESLKSQLLVAIPQLPDENFYRAVVLMIQHDDEGAFGVVLNRPSNVTVGEVWEQAGESCDSLAPIYVGGPVQGPPMAIHTDNECNETEILPGVYLATQKENLDRLVQQREHPVRIYCGFSGWAGGQLEGEMNVGGWLTTLATHEYIFDEAEDLWTRVSDDIGNEILFFSKGPNGPSDPSMN